MRVSLQNYVKGVPKSGSAGVRGGIWVQHEGYSKGREGGYSKGRGLGWGEESVATSDERLLVTRRMVVITT